MANPLLPKFPCLDHPVIGMLHLQPLPGAPGFGGDVAQVRQSLLSDAEALIDGGVDGLLIENYGDKPFIPRRVPAQVVSHMAALAQELRHRFKVPLGVNVLRNDGRSALAIAQATDADFIRVNVLCGARVTDQGLLQGIAHDLMRDRCLWQADRIRILADVNVKHSVPLAPLPIEQEVHDLIHRGGADGLIVTGSGTGKAAPLESLKAIKATAGSIPVLVGSGVDPENIDHFRSLADGFIIGTAFKHNGVTTQPVDAARVGRIMQMVKHRS